MSRYSINSVAISFLSAALLAGCASVPGQAHKSLDRKLDVVTESRPQGMDPIATAAFWGTRYDRDPADPKVAVEFSRALRAIGNDDESLRVVQNAQSRVGDDADLLLELGKSLIANDRPHEAIRPIQTAIVMGKVEDWRAHSALGVAYDRTGEHAQAILQYDRALALSPAEPQVLNNKGLSYALAGKTRLAETTLRTATSLPGGTAHIRQNYALVLALSGKTQEAERLARSDLPPSIADGNVAYYRSLVAQPAYWQGLNTDNSVQPDFGDDPSTISTTPKAQPVPEPGSKRPVQIKPAPVPVVPAAPKDTSPEAPTPAVSASSGVTGSESVAATGEPMVLPFKD